LAVSTKKLPSLQAR